MPGYPLAPYYVPIAVQYRNGRTLNFRSCYFNAASIYEARFHCHAPRRILNQLGKKRSDYIETHYPDIAAIFYRIIVKDRGRTFDNPFEHKFKKPVCLSTDGRDRLFLMTQDEKQPLFEYRGLRDVYPEASKDAYKVLQFIA